MTEHTPLAPTPGRPALGRRVRVIPTLLIDRDGRLVKTVKFGKRSYIGDPINAVRIFNTKEVDELVLIDIDASADGRGPSYERIADIAGEAFMPVAYGGGLMTEDQIAQVIACGVEKVADAEQRCGVGDAPLDLVLRRFAVLQPVGHVVEDAHVRIERIVLEDHSDIPVRRLEPVDEAVADMDLARADLLEPGDHAQER